MNLSDFNEVFAEVSRVLKKDGVALIFPVTKNDNNRTGYNRSLFEQALENMVVNSHGLVGWEIVKGNDGNEILKITKHELPDEESLRKSSERLESISQENEELRLFLIDNFRKNADVFINNKAFKKLDDGSICIKCLSAKSMVLGDNPVIFLSDEPNNQIDDWDKYRHEQIYEEMKKISTENPQMAKIIERVKYSDLISGYLIIFPDSDGIYKSNSAKRILVDNIDVPHMYETSETASKMINDFGINSVDTEDRTLDLATIREESRDYKRSTEEIEMSVRESNISDQLQKNAVELRKILPDHSVQTYLRFARRLYIEGNLQEFSRGWQMVKDLEKLIN